MHDIEAQISRISGQQNYMEHLQRITGNIEFVDMEMYHEKHTKIVNCDSNIKKILRKLLDEHPEIETLKTNYEKESSELSLKEKTFGTHIKKSKKSKKVRKPREIINQGYRPMELVKTSWFKMVKHIEKDIHKFLVEVFPQETPVEADKDQEDSESANSRGDDLITTSAEKYNEHSFNKSIENKTFADLENEYKLHPELPDIKTALNCKVTTNTTFTSMLLLKRFCKIIINVLLTPMYDVKKTINSHWSEIDRIFKTKAFQQAKIASAEDIVEILYQFIVAKYRATVTGNNKHYVKLFLDTVGNDNVSNMDGARFMEIMDAIDLEKLNKRDKVYKFAMGAKTAMQRIVKNEGITPEVLKEFDEMFKSSDDEDEKANEENAPEATCTDHADIFDE